MNDKHPAASGPGVAPAGSGRTPVRAGLLAASFCLVLVAVACGRATEEEINNALGITPTATRSQEQIAAATGTADARATSQAMAVASPGTAGDSDIALQLEGGDVTRGQVYFLQNCQACHGGAPTAPNLMMPGADVDLSAETFYAVVREGEGHPQPPGPFSEQRINEAALRDLYAFVLDRVRPS